MKKLMIVLVVLMVTVSAAFADRVVSADSLPQTAKDIIAQHFPGKSVMYAEADFNEYEVNLNDGTEIQFSGKGEWEEIKCYTGVPEALLNAAAVSYAKQQYPDAVICKAAVSGCSDYPGRKRLAQHRIKAVKQNGTVF